MILLTALAYSLRALSNGACGLLIFPAGRRTEASRELAVPDRAFPAPIWSVSLLLPGGVRLSLPPAALARAAERLPAEGLSALLDAPAAAPCPPVPCEEENARLFQLIARAGGRPLPAAETAALGWDRPAAQAAEALAGAAPLAVDPRGRLEGEGLARALPLTAAEERALRHRFALREPEEEHGPLRFFLPPGKPAAACGRRLPPGEYALFPGGPSRLLDAAALAGAAGAEACLPAFWPPLSETWELYDRLFGAGTVRPAEPSVLAGAARALLPGNAGRRLDEDHVLTEGDGAWLCRWLLRAGTRAADPARPLGRHGAQALIRRLCGLDALGPRRPSEALALLRLGAARAFCGGAPRVLRWDEREVRRMLDALERAL